MKRFISIISAVIALVGIAVVPPSACAQSKVYYLRDAESGADSMFKTTFPNTVGTVLLTPSSSLMAVDVATSAPFYIEGGSINARGKSGPRPILLYANITEGFTIDNGSRSFVYVGGSSVRALYSMGFNPTPAGPLPNPQSLLTFSDLATPRYVATLDATYAFVSQDNRDGTSSIYRVSLKDAPSPALLWTQTDGDQGGRPITALAVDSATEILYFCQQGATSVIQALNLAQTGPTPLLTYDGECRGLAVDERNGYLYVAGKPNAGAPGLAAYKISQPLDYFQFEIGQTVSSVSIEPARLLTSTSIKPAAPVVDVNKKTATIYFEKFIRGGLSYKINATLKYPSGLKKSFTPNSAKEVFKDLAKGTFSISYKLKVKGSDGKTKMSPSSVTRTFKVE